MLGVCSSREGLVMTWEMLMTMVIVVVFISAELWVDD